MCEVATGFCNRTHFKAKCDYCAMYRNCTSTVLELWKYIPMQRKARRFGEEDDVWTAETAASLADYFISWRRVPYPLTILY